MGAEYYETIFSTRTQVLHRDLTALIHSNTNDPCLYVRHSAQSIMLIALYVDDLLIAGKESRSIARIKEELRKRFEMKDLGEARLCLGLEITRDRANRTLHL